MSTTPSAAFLKLPQERSRGGGETMQVMKTPKSVDIEITNRCNLRCTYCSHFTSAGDVGLDLRPRNGSPPRNWAAALS